MAPPQTSCLALQKSDSCTESGGTTVSSGTFPLERNLKVLKRRDTQEVGLSQTSGHTDSYRGVGAHPGHCAQAGYWLMPET